MDNKPTVKLIGEDGNIFNLMGLASRALKKIGRAAEASQLQYRVMNEARSYDAALVIIMEYVDVE